MAGQLLSTVRDTENVLPWNVSIGNLWVVAGWSTFVHMETVGYWAQLPPVGDVEGVPEVTSKLLAFTRVKK